MSEICRVSMGISIIRFGNNIVLWYLFIVLIKDFDEEAIFGLRWYFEKVDFRDCDSKEVIEEIFFNNEVYGMGYEGYIWGGRSCGMEKEAGEERRGLSSKRGREVVILGLLVGWSFVSGDYRSGCDRGLGGTSWGLGFGRVEG